MINIEKSFDDEFSDFIHLKLREYNDNSSHYHKEYRKDGEIKKINLVAKDNDICIGGIIAEVYWGWLNIEYLWVDEKYRGKGFGSKLLNEAEKIAINLGCDKAQLSTFEFQGRSFYEKRGYKVVGKLEDYPPSSTYYWMSKNFQP